MSRKLTFDEAMERVYEERSIDRSEVLASALSRKVWVMHYSAPGCLPDYTNYSMTRADAISGAIELYADDAPRGFATALRRDGIAPCDPHGYYSVSIERLTLGDILS